MLKEGTKMEQIKAMFRECRGTTDLDEDTIECLCSQLDGWWENSTFKTYWSSFKHTLEWCITNEINPKVITEVGSCCYVRGGLEDNVSVQAIKRVWGNSENLQNYSDGSS